jgi:hypothetical protein
MYAHPLPFLRSCFFADGFVCSITLSISQHQRSLDVSAAWSGAVQFQLSLTRPKLPAPPASSSSSSTSSASSAPSAAARSEGDSLATDGRFLYLHSSQGLEVWGTGAQNTIKGHRYRARPNYRPTEKCWLGCVKGKLYVRSRGMAWPRLEVVDCDSLETERVLVCGSGGEGERFTAPAQPLASGNPLLSDGRYLYLLHVEECTLPQVCAMFVRLRWCCLIVVVVVVCGAYLVLWSCQSQADSKDSEPLSAVKSLSDASDSDSEADDRRQRKRIARGAGADRPNMQRAASVEAKGEKKCRVVVYVYDPLRLVTALDDDNALLSSAASTSAVIDPNDSLEDRARRAEAVRRHATARELSDSFGYAYSPALCAVALQRCAHDLNAAAKWLLENGEEWRTAPKMTLVRRLVLAAPGLCLRSLRSVFLAVHQLIISVGCVQGLVWARPSTTSKTRWCMQLCTKSCSRFCRNPNRGMRPTNASCACTHSRYSRLQLHPRLPLHSLLWFHLFC